MISKLRIDQSNRFSNQLTHLNGIIQNCTTVTSLSRSIILKKKRVKKKNLAISTLSHLVYIYVRGKWWDSLQTSISYLVYCYYFLALNGSTEPHVALAARPMPEKKVVEFLTNWIRTCWNFFILLEKNYKTIMSKRL